MHPAASLEIATPEAVALDLDVAGLGHRGLAWCADACVIATTWFTALFLLSYLRTFDLTRLSGVGVGVQLLLVGGFFFFNWGYAVVFEALLGGQTPGKRLLGIRVVRRDGSPATFVDLALRNLCRGIDFLPLFYVTGVITMMASSPSRRLGDLLAGTVVIREHRVDLGRYQVRAPSAASGQAPLSAAQLELVLGFLGRAPELEPAARDRIAQKLAACFQERLAEPERAKLADPATAEAFLRALAKGEG